jgi:hypothetical protein
VRRWARHWVVWVLLLPTLVLGSYLIFSLLAALLLAAVVLLPLSVAVAGWLLLWKEG